MDNKKITFRLEDGTEVTADISIYKAYKQSRNREQYIERTEHSHTSFSLDDERSVTLADSFDTFEESEKIIRYDRLRQAIGKLPEHDRQLIRKYFFEGHTVRELAKNYGVSHTNIHRQLVNAIEKLKCLLHNCNTDDLL